MPAKNKKVVAVCGVVATPWEIAQPSWLSLVLEGLGAPSWLSKAGLQVGVMACPWKGMSEKSLMIGTGGLPVVPVMRGKKMQSLPLLAVGITHPVGVPARPRSISLQVVVP